MAFQAYPTSPSRKDAHALLRLQNILHGSDSVVLPGCLLLVGSALLVYQHMTDDDTGRHSIRNFLAKILVSMLPLAILERRILACAEPVALFARMSSKVLIMHTCFLLLRVAAKLIYDVQVGFAYWNIACLTAVCLMLPTIFRLRPSFASLYEHRDVLGLAFVAMTIAVLEVLMLSNYSRKAMFGWAWRSVTKDIFITCSDYVEILSFVPAVWMACRKDGTSGIDTRTGDLGDSQRRAVCLFTFLLAFYSCEDMYHACQHWRQLPLVTIAHTAHYLLLVDCATFLLAHLYDPDKVQKLRGAVLTWVQDVCAV